MKAHNSIPMIGKKFSRLLVIEEVERINIKRPRYRCQCDCGALTIVEGRHLRDKKIMSCGCFAAENAGFRSRTHGLSNTAEYSVWCGMKRRCFNKNDSRYVDYGGRGISMCDRWANSFDAFLNDMGVRPTSRHSIDRIDVNKGYEPSNCRWILMSDQAKNRRSNVVLSLRGRSMTLSEWANEIRISASTISARIRCGWTTEDALTKPLRGYPS